jgi:hypothetical protein
MVLYKYVYNNLHKYVYNNSIYNIKINNKLKI